MVVRIAEESGLHTGQLRVSSYRDDDPADSSGFEAITTDSTDTDRDSDHNQEDSMNQQDVPTELTEMPQDPVVTLLLQDGSSRTFLVNEGSNIIGRSNDADFRLPDTGVSRQHAEITWDGQDAVLVDLQSTNGTTVNDTPVENWLLADGDVITVGHSHIEVRIVDPTRSSTTARR
jgi:pSer/pThr/pTyr-binding forkhead associated (FHA) protein